MAMASRQSEPASRIGTELTESSPGCSTAPSGSEPELNHLEHVSAVPRRVHARVLQINWPSKNRRGRRECRVMTSPMVRLQQKSRRQSPQVRPDQPAFPARWFTAYIAISSGTGLSCPRRQRDAKHHRQLDLSVGRPGPRDFAVRVSHVRPTCHPRPSHPRLTCRDDRAYVPLHRGGIRENIVLICPTRQAPIPAADWHDGQFVHGAHAEAPPKANAPSYRFIMADHDPPYELGNSVTVTSRPTSVSELKKFNPWLASS